MAARIKLLLSTQGALNAVRRCGKRFYVYLIYGGTLGVTYVGKGTRNRVVTHERAARKFLDANPGLPYEEWLLGDVRLRTKTERLAAHLSYAPLRYDFALFTDDEDEAFEVEKKLTQRFGLAVEHSGCLSNRVIGGRSMGPGLGHVFTDDRRKRISKALKGRVFSPDHKRRISEALRGRSIPKEVSRRGGETRRGRKASVDHRRNVSKGRLNSELIPRVAVRINGVTYRSIAEAVKPTGLSYGQLVYRINAGVSGFARI